MNLSSQAPIISPSPASTAPKGVVRVAGWIALAVPIVAFMVVWFRFAVNVPKWDDHALKAFLVNFQHENTFTGKVYQLFRQHNEHRIVWDRLVTWFDYTVFGKIDYVRLMAIGNLSLIGLLVIFGLILQRGSSQSGRRSVWYVLPVACLLFNLGHWENMFWGMAALSNLPVLFWVTWSLYLLIYTRHQWASIGLALLASITLGGGLVIWPISLVILLHKTLTQPARIRSWRPFLWQAASAAACIGLYFTGYEKPAVTPTPHISLATFLQGWLLFNGAAAEAIPVGTPFQTCAILGLVVVALFVAFGFTLLRQHTLFSRPWPPIAYFFVGLAGYLFATSIVVVVSRTGFGLETLFTSRYKIYSLCLLALLYIYAAATLPERFQPITLGTGLVVGGALAWLSYPAYLDDSRRLQQWLLTSQFNWTYTQNRPISSIDAQTARILDNASAPYDQCLPQLFGPVNAPAMTLDTLYPIAVGYNLAIDRPQSLKPDSETTAVYIRLHSNQRTYLVSTEPAQNASRWAKLGLTRLIRPGFTATVQRDEYASGTYDIDVVTMGRGGCQLHPTGQRMTLASVSKPAVRTNW